ncbi:DNA primase [Algirhabdus cladophorae]|uniref:DNA primase n=1 Tax=Algirhabdus cladophorae TaxID=3377108 RepID=UPI003B84A392
MSLPPGFLDELRTRVSISQVVGRKVMWDTRKSNQGKGDMWSPCPFHHEKTASFHVDDRKGYYYCFGCHAKGDAISFVRETENVGFMEAIQILASEAGMTVPQSDPKAQEKADRRTELSKVMEMAVQHFKLQLKTGGAAAARDYLAGRKLKPQTLDQFDIGFAPDAWQGLWDHLRGKDVPEDHILACGLAKPSTKGGKPYDTFRGRIQFPIRDPRGRCIGFGGRAMDPNDNAKYLNSPETELFDKGRSLYNHGPAREAAGKGQPLIVAEGYMDVIALVEGGFGAAVAPLGTAITEDQLRLMWRVSPEPIIALDGDKAGIRAAMRVIDLALPLLEAGQSLRFAVMPEGQDPDDLIRSQGREAVQAVLDGAMPMVDLLWQRETEGRVFDSPERKAALDKDLRAKLKLIQDPSIRNHYGEAIKELRYQLFRGARPAYQPGAKRQYVPRGTPAWKVSQPQATTKSSRLAQATGTTDDALREAVILAVLIQNPKVLPEFAGALEDLEFSNADSAHLRDAILNLVEAGDAFKEALYDSVGGERVETLLGQSHLAIVPAIRNPDPQTASLCVAEELAKLSAHRGHAREVSEALEDMDGLVDEGLTWRLQQAAAALDTTQAPENDDQASYDIGANGAKVAKTERDALNALLDGISFSKNKK